MSIWSFERICTRGKKETVILRYNASRLSIVTGKLWDERDTYEFILQIIKRNDNKLNIGPFETLWNLFLSWGEPKNVCGTKWKGYEKQFIMLRLMLSIS